MAWAVPKPMDQWSDREVFTFLREIHTRLKAGSFAWNPPNVPANSTVDTTLTTSDAVAIKGLRSGQAIHVTPPSSIDSGIVVAAAWVPADDELTIRLGNITGSAINPASGTWAFMGVLT